MAHEYPWFKFFTKDWVSDPNLRRCSLAARGAWIDMVCLMYDCERPGVLASNGKPWPIEEIATAIGAGQHGGTAPIRELLDKGVARLDDSGAVYSRRVIRDVQIRDKKAVSGAKGGRVSKTEAKAKQKPSKPLSGSDSGSESVSDLFKELFRNLGERSALRTEAFKRAWADWDQHRREIGHKLTPRTVKSQAKKLETLGHDRAIAAIEYSIQQGYRGVFEPPQGNSGPARSAKDRRAEKRLGDFPEPEGPIPLFNRREPSEGGEASEG